MNDVTATVKPARSGFRKFITWFLLIGFLLGGFLFWWNYYFVFGVGVKSGELNYVVKKGNLFKTYEGKLIQPGFRSKGTGSVQSYEFEFSVVDDSLADLLMRNSGSYFDLHYKEYKHSIPWRGFSPYIVDQVLAIKKVEH